MGAARGMAAPAVSDLVRRRLAGEPTAFQFFQAVRLLERLSPDRRPVGTFVDPADEVVRFRAHPSIAFPASEIQSAELPSGDRATLVVNFMGLTGPVGVLPYHYTLTVAERLRARDRTLRDFLDLFHHRIISLFYRAWEKNHFTVGHERDARDPLTRHVRDLVGATDSSGNEALLFYAGLLLPHQRSALALQQLLEDYFGVHVLVEQFVGAWYPVAGDGQCVVTDDEGAAGRLGLGAAVGDAVWDPQARVRLRLGPLTRSQYDDFLPGGAAHAALRTLTRYFSGDGFDVEVQLVLARDDVPACALGADDTPPSALGWGTWVRTAPFTRDADDTVFTL
jgi:type VI secretion system protein ImpH